MSLDSRTTPLMKFLQAGHPELYGKVLELRDVIQDWLTYIPQTFPHYTRHTALHSDAIILQASRLLFKDADHTQPVIRLSGVEAYVLAAAAYLHDAGMVVSDHEKSELLKSEDWRIWTTNSAAAAKRLAEIRDFRNSGSPPDGVVRNFLADVQSRFLISEFIRRTHHLRASEMMAQQEDQLGRFAFGDPVLLRTIAEVCVAHGLRESELEDRDRYPDRRDLRGEQVNVRFLAIMLRLGDLLDMSTDRACPFLMNAACPLPAESYAHWTQYQRLSHMLTSPDRIEITAYCKNQEEHRYLIDWCHWIVGEVSNAAVLMARSTRHTDWHAPVATIDCSQATIKILPAADAKYIPSNWRFELDQDLVFRRLIEDLYTEPYSFVRELIQNGLDATRCQMYLDLRADGIDVPDSPTQVPEDRRKRYALKLELLSRELTNPLSDEVENRQVLSIEDFGIGMDREIIERYLLQVGRSYYTTYAFQKQFKFIPTSRFGVGFLSVFNASEHVSIETFKPSSGSGDGPLRLELTGPRNYLLLERGQRRRSGTRIEILLRKPMESGQLTEIVSNWCRRVEFPIHVNDLGANATISAERKEQFTYEIPDVIHDGAKLGVRAFDIQRSGIEGELYVFTRTDDHGESWDAWSDAKYRYPSVDPRASEPRFPESLHCIHGIGISRGGRSGPVSERLDFRGGRIPVPPLSRDLMMFDFRHRMPESDERVYSRWVEILKEHLSTSKKAQSPEGWRYKQSLVDDFASPAFWACVPGTIPIHSRLGARATSLEETKRFDSIAVIMEPQTSSYGFAARTSLPPPIWDQDVPAILGTDLARFSKTHRIALFNGNSIQSARWLGSGQVVLYWTKGADDSNTLKAGYYESKLAKLPGPFSVGFAVHSTSDSDLDTTLFNTTNPLVQWVLRLRAASQTATFGITEEHFQRIYESLRELPLFLYNLKDFEHYIERWREWPGLPAELKPPTIKLSREMFIRQFHEGDG
jgi:molecular chaperone HtpG